MNKQQLKSIARRAVKSYRAKASDNDFLSFYNGLSGDGQDYLKEAMEIIVDSITGGIETYRQDMVESDGDVDSAVSGLEDQISYAYDALFDNSRPLGDADHRFTEAEGMGVFGSTVAALENTVRDLDPYEKAQRRKYVSTWEKIAKEIKKLLQEI